jgi:HAD superfamily hydrolase (TIGR01509 family)
VVISARIRVPDDTGALLWDLDGVVLDTLTMEYDLVQELLARHAPTAGSADRELVRRAFPHTIPEFWRLILTALDAEPTEALVAQLTDALEHERTVGSPAVLTGVRELLADARAGGLRVAVVSNNPVHHVEELLERAGLRGSVETIVGNDQGLPGKPAPDMYLAGADAVGLPPQRCVALEDSLLGAQAARAAGCFVVGVATGAATFAELEAADTVDVAYRRFAPCGATLAPGDVTRKRLDTPNEFVSHMLEHIAWRTGCAITVDWAGDDWDWLGHAVGEQLAVLLDGEATLSRALGLIDDGSCEVTLERTQADAGLVVLTGSGPGGVDPERFVGMRVEQLTTGLPLVQLLEGLTRACGLRLTVALASLEDPHHTWEATYRAVGIALRGLSRTLIAHAEGTGDTTPTDADDGRAARGYGLRVEHAGPDTVRVVRTTAESVCVADVALAPAACGLALTLATSDSVRCEGLVDLVARLGAAAGLSGALDFSALELSSSHVVAEDVGMTLGAAVKELATQRMHAFGIEGAGASVTNAPVQEPIRVGVSFEGRKFLQLVPLGWTREELRDQLIGGTLTSGLFTEDLDDFLDGFVGGMGASVVVHWEPVADLDAAWALVFTGLGLALGALLAPNHAKRALIAGVKATLA